MNIPVEEMQVDLANTESDIQQLAAIVGALDVFITRNGGEDRSSFRADRFRYNALLSQAHNLKQRIESAITDATNDLPTS